MLPAIIIFYLVTVHSTYALRIMKNASSDHNFYRQFQKCVYV